MIFLTKKIRNRNKIDVIVYDSLEDLSQRVEWQDILDISLKILDNEGKVYVWDDSKTNEAGTVYNYSFKTIGTDLVLVEKCRTKFRLLGKPDSFEIEAIQF